MTPEELGTRMKGVSNAIREHTIDWMDGVAGEVHEDRVDVYKILRDEDEFIRVKQYLSYKDGEVVEKVGRRLKVSYKEDAGLKGAFVSKGGRVFCPLMN